MERMFVLLLLCFCSSVCLAQQDVTDPDIQTFQDWSLQCDADQSDVCQMLQTASVDGLSHTTFLLSISTGQDSSNHYAVATVPLGVYLSNGIEIHIDDRHVFKLHYEICDTKGCHAGFRMSGAVLHRFKKGEQAKFRVWVGREKAVDFPVSLMGFTNGYAAFVNHEIAP